MITIREATGGDAAAIQKIFLACYGTDYTDPSYYDDALLTRLIYSENTLLLVAEDSESKQVVGTASVNLEAGADSDLVGEFCRLAVHPDDRQRGVGKLLLSERLRRVQDRLQVGIVDARATHAYSVKIAEAHGFAVVGFVPERWQMRERESLAVLVRFFGNALELRNQHPRIIPEVCPLAQIALENCSLPTNAMVVEDADAYPPGHDFDVEELTTEGYAALLRIERGRVRRREIFGPARLHYGIFKLQARSSRYLIAREDRRIVGAIGFTLDPIDQSVRIFELIALHDEAVRFLLTRLEQESRENWGCLIEVDVSAYAPRMQRTLLELGFLPVAYLPALVFHDVERLDVVKMLRLLNPPHVGTDHLTPNCKAVADLVLRLFHSRTMLPRIARVAHELPLFSALNAEQVARLAGVCDVAAFETGATMFRQGEESREMFVILEGEVTVNVAGSAGPVGTVRSGECLGELSLLTSRTRSATATANTPVEAAVLAHDDLVELIRLRPDIGLHIYRNLALGMGEKLNRMDISLARLEMVRG
jgi:ribosomal protein S18 acetylase RimI-like enzyme